MRPLALIASSWLWEASALIIVLSLYRIEDKKDALHFILSTGGKLFVAAVVMLGFATVLVRRVYGTLQKEGKRPIETVIKWNVLPLILIVTIAEVALRVLDEDKLSNAMLGGKPLGPQSLDATFRDRSQVDEEILVYDELLGWTVRAKLSSNDGMYFASVEGIRSLRSDVVYAHPIPDCRIALLGDSTTFGEEEQFADTWGHQLEKYLPARCQVLNFGVSGYSVDQMYLRYLRDVRPWNPDIVILSLTSHSATRTMGVYGLTMFPDGKPWAKPRFQFQGDVLNPINVPLPPPESIVTARSIKDLPFIDYDWFFSPGLWELPRWQYLYSSYLFRLYISRFPIWRTQHKGDSEEAINHELLRSFVRTAESAGSTPVILYLPDKNDYKDPVRQDTPSLKILRSSGLRYFDLRSCLDDFVEGNRFIPHRGHYSAEASAEIARCVATLIPPNK